MPDTSVVDSFGSVISGITSGDKKTLTKITPPKIKRDFGGELFLSGIKFIAISESLFLTTIYRTYKRCCRGIQKLLAQNNNRIPTHRQSIIADII